MRLASIVEGHGDVESVPILLRRLAAPLGIHELQAPPGIRIPRDQLVRPDGIERAVKLAVLKLGGAGGIVVVLDADDDAECRLGPELLSRVTRARPDVPAVVVLAVREFEAWFLAGVESLRGRRGIPAGADAPESPESTRGAKERIAALMKRGYSEVTDQPALAAVLDLATAAARSPSFAKFCRDVEGLLRCLSRGGDAIIPEATPSTPRPES